MGAVAVQPACRPPLGRAGNELRDQDAANFFRLLVLTGARRGELMSARWQDFDPEARVWTKPSAP